MKTKTYIGTSGWHYAHWVGPFYPAETAKKDFLEYYVKAFSTVEINNSFYQLPKPKTWKAWKAQAPKNFVFAVKASRYITHVKKLMEPSKGVGHFLEMADILQASLGPILFQLPPSWKCNIKRLESFLEYLPRTYRYAFEFRNPSWFDPEVCRLLCRYNCAFCIYDLNGRLSPREATANFVYIRLHGPGAAYQGSYDQKTLHMWAKAIDGWNQQGKDVYCYFDNDQAGYAAQNALTLKEMVAANA